jgi:stringent starvation protein B
MNPEESPSTRPYLVRALYEWCTDNGLTPYVAVMVDETVQVPREYVKDGEIVLNVSFDATSSLKLGNDFIEFKARFGGKPRDIMVPMNRVMAIYARENGQGMAFPVNRADRIMPSPEAGQGAEESSSALTAVPVSGKTDEPEVLLNPNPNPTTRPTLTRIK